MMGPAPFARLVLLPMRSDRTPAPFMPMPPDHDSIFTTTPPPKMTRG